MINVGNTRWRLGRTMIALFVVSLSLLFIRQNVYADIDSNPEIVNKAIATSLLECYSAADVFKTPLTVGEFNEGSGVKKFMNKNGISAGAPNGYLSGDPSTCDGFMGKLLEKKQLAIPDSNGNVDSFLKTIGYTSTSSNSVSGDCFNYKFKYKENGVDMGVKKTHSICPVVDSSGKITSIDFGKDGQSDNSGVVFSKDGATLRIDFASYAPQVTIDAEGLTYGEFKNKVATEVSKQVNLDLPLYAGDASGMSATSWTFIEAPKDVPRKEVDTEYTKDDTSVGTAMQALIGEKYDDTPTFSDEEKFVLYQSYLIDYYNSKIRCDLSDDEVSSLGGSYKETKYYDGEEIKTCYVVETNNSGKKVHGIESGKFSLEANCDFDCVTSWLKNSSVTKDGLKDFNLSMGDDKGNEVSDPSGEGEEDECISSKGAGSLGWVVCPLLKWMSDAATQTYEDYVAPSLQIEPTLFNGGGGDNVKTAWGTFRDIANVLFIILFLVVIFSQLTGIGIDNYGIKKILPRLIVAAIMINLSYIICILLVDLSNILGNGLKGIFDALGAQLNPVVDFTADGAESSGGAVSGVLASVGVLAAVGVMGGAIWANPAILLSLLVGALGVIVSIFFLFILLAVRKAAVIVLTVISPLAVVAYMLPNTKKLFDKWWRFFEGLLLIYPIAGLLVGGGDYISRLLLGTSTGFLTGLTAMIVGIVPIFFIPTALKGAFAAMGKVGGTLAGMGSMARGRVTGAARGIDAYKNLQNRGLERRTRLRAGIDANGRAKKLSGAGVLLRGGRRNVAAARASYDKTQGERIREDMWMDPQYTANRAKYRETAASNEREKMYSDLFASRDRKTNESELRSALTGTDAEKASAAMSTLISQGGIDEVLSSMKDMSSAEWNGMDGEVKTRLTQTMGASGIDALKSFSKYVSTGGKASFSDWATGSISAKQMADEANAGVKDGTYAQHLMDGGERAMSSYSKDEMKFIEDNADAIRNNMEQQFVASGGTANDGRNAFGSMLMNTSLNSGDAKAQTAAEGVLSKQIADNNLDISNLGITSDKMSRMRGEAANAIMDGYTSLWQRTNPNMSQAQAQANALNYIRTNTSTQIAGLQSDQQALNRTNNETRGVFGV